MRVAYVDSSWSGKSPLMGGSTAAGHGSLLLLGVGGMCNGYGIVDDDALRLAGEGKTNDGTTPNGTTRACQRAA